MAYGLAPVPSLFYRYYRSGRVLKCLVLLPYLLCVVILIMRTDRFSLPGPVWSLHYFCGSSCIFLIMFVFLCVRTDGRK